MLKELLKNKKFCDKIRSLLKEKLILDIILFGSVVKGKKDVNDVDILVLYSKKIEETEELTYKIRKEIEKIIPAAEIITKAYEELFNPEFIARESYILEGFSMKNRKLISESLGYSSFKLFKYSQKNFGQTKRMQFHYALHGRGKNAGILKSADASKFSDNAIIVPIESSETIKEMLEKWKLEYEEVPIIIPQRLKNKILIK